MYFIARNLVEFFIRRKFRIHIHNRHNLPDKKTAKAGGFIIACNHQLYWDPPAVAAVVKGGKFSFMAKAELFEKKMFAALIRMCGAFPVVRGAGAEESLERAFNDIKRGRIFVIFPEGTRSRDGTINRGKSGVALIAAKANAPVLPVCLMYGLKGEKKRLDCAVGEFIPASDFFIDGNDRSELKRVSGRVMEPIKELQKQILDNVNE